LAGGSKPKVQVLTTGGASLDAATFKVALAAANVGIRALAEVKNLLLSLPSAGARQRPLWLWDWKLKLKQKVFRAAVGPARAPRELYAVGGGR
jgi:hypothetical protein